MRILVVVAAAVTAAAALVGCSGGPSPRQAAGAAGAATSSGDVLAIWRNFAACARTHGVPGLPDPQLDSTGKVQFPGYESRSVPASVKTGCRSILDRLPPDVRPDAAPTDIPALLRYAQCMRVHGFPDWPDPKPDGTFPAAQLPNVKTPAVVSAMQACDSLNPDHGGHVFGS